MGQRLWGLSIYELNGLEREMNTTPMLQRGMTSYTFIIINILDIAT